MQSGGKPYVARNYITFTLKTHIYLMSLEKLHISILLRNLNETLKNLMFFIDDDERCKSAYSVCYYILLSFQLYLIHFQR